MLQAIRAGLAAALQQLGRPWESVTVIARSDSTLRGHFPLDVEALCGGGGGEGRGKGKGKKRVVVVAPYFEAGGRLTVRGAWGSRRRPHERDGGFTRPSLRAVLLFTHNQLLLKTHTHTHTHHKSLYASMD